MAADEKPPVTFEKDVKPVFRKHCVTCHNADRPRGELDLSTYAGLMTGGVSGKAAVAGKPDDSPVYTLRGAPRRPEDAAEQAEDPAARAGHDQGLDRRRAGREVNGDRER